MKRKIPQEELLLLLKNGGNDASLMLLEKINDAVEDIENKFKAGITDLGNEIKNNLNLVEKGVKVEYEKYTTDVALKLAQKMAEMSKGEDGADGKDGETPSDEKLLSLIKPLIPPVIKPKDGVSPDVNKIIDEVTQSVLQSIPENNPVTQFDDTELNRKIDSFTDKFEDLLKKVEELSVKIESIPQNRGGGGTSAIGVAQAFKYIAKTEQPTGDINGVNTTYTVKSNIWWIAGFTLNGEQIAQLPNYTYSGRTITFNTALPADYSGSDFEIKYIGS